jgi:hypothetical protein
MIGRQTHDTGLEICGLALHGHALLQTRMRAESMRLLDEASAALLGGDMTEVLTLSLIQCELLYACHEVRDYDRAVEWCDNLIACSERFRLPTLLGYCRTRYADIREWCGRWSEAEAQLDAARRIFAEKRRSLSSDAIVRRAGASWRAASASGTPRRGGGALHAGRAAPTLDPRTLDAHTGSRRSNYRSRTGRALSAASAAGEPGGRAPGLEALISAQALAGNLEPAGAALEELARITTALGTEPLRARQS